MYKTPALNAVMSTIRSLLNPPVVLDIVKNFTVFATNRKKQKVKILGRHQQYDATNLIAQLGASLVWSTKLNGHQFSAELNLGIEQALINDQDNQAATMVNAPVSFYQSFADDDNTRAAVGLRIGYDLTPNTTIYGGYEGYYSSNSSNNFDAGIRVNF